MSAVWKNKLKTIGDGGFLFAATLLVNIGNYGLNLILGRWLGPEGFAEANLLATIVMVLSFIAMGLQLTTAKFIAEDQESSIQYLKKNLTYVSVAIGLFLIMASPWLKQFLQFESIHSLIILFIGIPFYFNMSISRGYYQGTSNFKKLAWTYIIEMVARLIITISLLSIFIDRGFNSECIAFAFLASFILCDLYAKFEAKSDSIDLVSIKRIGSFLAIIAMYELSQILINNSDVILVKHLFPAYEAGLYASVALLGRAVFFATWTVVTILFPLVIEKEKKGEPHLRLFWNALLIVAGIGVCMVIGAWLLGPEVMSIAFGPAYISMADYLWVYALLTCIFACANVFVYYNMSLENYTPVLISIVIGILQIFLIALFHNSIQQVLLVQVSLMSLMLLSMVFYQVYNTYNKQNNSEIELKKASVNL